MIQNFKVKRQRSYFYKIVTWSLLLLIMFIISVYRFIVTSNHPLAIHRNYIYIEPLRSYYRDKNHSKVMIDWNDHEAIRLDKKKEGDGEQGGEIC